MLQSYYRKPDVPDNNFSADDVFLQLNCAGEHIYNIKLDASSVREDYYLFYLYKGKVKIMFPKVKQKVMIPGDFIIYDRNCPFHYGTEEGVLLDYFWVHFGGYGVENILASCDLSTNTVYSAGNFEAVKQLFIKIFDTFKPKDRLFDVVSANNLISLLAELSRFVYDGEKSSEGERLKVSLEYIHAHYTEDVSVSKLASLEYLSPSRYRTVFKKRMNSSPLSYITNLRLNQARELLLHTCMDVSAVSEAVGYSDSRYFSRLFKNRFALSPREYRSGNTRRKKNESGILF